MAIIQSALLSKGRGSAGSVTFRRLNGKTVVSEKPLVVKNPDTVYQRRTRMLFMVGANQGWALNPYFAARPSLTAVRTSTGVSARGSKLLPIQDLIKRAVKIVSESGPARTQISAYAQSVPSNQVNYALRNAVLVGATSPIFQALQNLDVTGLPRENSELAISNISVDEGVIQVPMTVKPVTSVMSVRATIYVIVAVASEGSVNRYMVTRTVEQPPAAGGAVSVQTSIQIPVGQSIHRVIVEAVPLYGEQPNLEPDYSLTIGDAVLLNE